MFSYELHQERHNDLQHRADHWRLVRDVKAARTAQRRARRARSGGAGGAVRTDAEGAPSPHSSLAAVRRVLHPRSAA